MLTPSQDFRLKWQGHSSPYILLSSVCQWPAQSFYFGQCPQPGDPLHSCFFFYVYSLSFGCVRSQLRHVGSPFCPTASLVAMCRLSRCGVRAQLPLGTWDLSSLSRAGTLVPCLARQILNHRTPGEVTVL